LLVAIKAVRAEAQTGMKIANRFPPFVAYPYFLPIPVAKLTR
jgi:hypothetical protein